MHTQLPINKNKVLELLQRLALEAGEIIRQFETGHAGKVASIYKKKDGTQYTDADVAAENHIMEGLQKNCPGILVIGEESFSAQGLDQEALDQIKHSGSIETYFIIDALDGTRHFISGTGEYSVNIALIDKGMPVLGVIYAPSHDHLYYTDGLRSYFRDNEGQTKELIGYTGSVPDEERAVIFATSDKKAYGIKGLIGVFPHINVSQETRLLKLGSSLKFCRISSGDADLYVRAGSICQWDVAAGHAILSSACGGVYTFIDMVEAQKTGLSAFWAGGAGQMRYGLTLETLENKLRVPGFMALSERIKILAAT